MNLDELRAWISANFYKKEQVVSWAESVFYRRKSHKQTRTSTGSSALPIITNLNGYVDPSFYDLSDYTNFQHDHEDAAGGGQLGTNALTDSAITTAKIADLAVTDAKLAANSVVTAKINDLAVTNGKLATNAVTTSKVTDASITDVKLASNSVTTAKMVNDAITNAKLNNMAQATIKGRAVGAGTGDPVDLTANELNTVLSSSTNQLTLTSLLVNNSLQAGTVYPGSGGLNLTSGHPTPITGFITPAGTSATIASGVITVTGSLVTVDTEGGASTDNLDTINGGVFGDLLVLRILTAAHDVVLKDGTGNISCPSDRTLDSADDMWLGFFNGVRWCEISFSNNA